LYDPGTNHIRSLDDFLKSAWKERRLLSGIVIARDTMTHLKRGG
jgi:hypothetical protein